MQKTYVAIPNRLLMKSMKAERFPMAGLAA
jgi:hypothetical protein